MYLTLHMKTGLLATPHSHSIGKVQCQGSVMFFIAPGQELCIVFFGILFAHSFLCQRGRKEVRAK